MKPRHAAALALVGWYLMAPPILQEMGFQRPLSQWQLYDRFETLAECRQLKDDQWNKFVDAHDSDGRGMITDDPRLKEK
jgi:hypothetical protein